ncbi:MAG: glycosyltransferase family 4 protein [Myxococcota bacterium]|nr:glycosyltransferase family 4 protein [Myxococcota bacterium]
MTWHVVSVDAPPRTIGGVAAWSADAAAALAGAGQPVVLYGRRDGATSEWDAARPHPVVRMRGRSWLRRQAAWAALAVGPRLRRGDRLLCATWTVATALQPVAHALGIPCLVGAHGSELTMLRSAPAPLRRMGPHVRWVPVSHFLAGELCRLGGSGWRRHVIPMPLELGPQPSPGRREGLICVARDTPLKGIDRAQHLARLLGEPLRLIGASRPQDGADREAGGLLRRDRARAALGTARAAVLLPRTTVDGFGAEGLGLCLLEAAAAGTPTIGCRTGGVPEAIGPGMLLGDPDEPDAGAVRAWLATPGQGERARAWVESHHGPAAFLATLAEAEA